MKHTRKYLSIFLVAVMIISALSLVACNPQSNDKDQGIKNENVSISKFSLAPQSTQFISLSASAPTRSATNANVIEHTLTATVLPESAENKEVDWSVAWAQTAISLNVEDYVTVTPQSDGSNVAIVACHKPFTGNVIITVTTREGGFTAQCVCKYVGLPSAMEVDLSDLSMITDTDWNVDVVEVSGDGSTSYHEINLSNIFGEPGADFTPNYRLHMEPHGGIVTKITTYDADGNVISTEQGELLPQTIDFQTPWYYSSYFATNSIVNYVHVGFRDGQLYITGHNYPESISWEKKNADGTTTKTEFDGFIDDKEPYIHVTLTEENTGLTYTFNVRAIGTVNNVNLDYNEIIF